MEERCAWSVRANRTPQLLRKFPSCRSDRIQVGVGEAQASPGHRPTPQDQRVRRLPIETQPIRVLDLLSQLHTAAPAAHVVVLTGVRYIDIHRRAVRLGAMVLVLKEKAAEVLLEAIVKVHAGEVWADGLLQASVLSEMTRSRTNQRADPEAIKIGALTARERDIIVMIGQGLKNQKIADRLCISEATVRHHLTSIYAKLSVGDRLALAIYA